LLKPFLPAAPPPGLGPQGRLTATRVNSRCFAKPGRRPGIPAGLSKPSVSDALWNLIAPLLPPEPPEPKGGWPCLPDWAALTGILSVRRTGLPGALLPPRWVRQRHDLLAAAPRRAARGRGGAAPPHPARAAWGGRPKRWGPREPGQPRDRPASVARGKAGGKPHVMVDRTGKSVNVLLSAANCHDATGFEAVPDGGGRVERLLGRPCQRPDKRHADKA